MVKLVTEMKAQTIAEGEADLEADLEEGDSLEEDLEDWEIWRRRRRRCKTE